MTLRPFDAEPSGTVIITFSMEQSIGLPTPGYRIRTPSLLRPILMLDIEAYLVSWSKPTGGSKSLGSSPKWDYEGVLRGRSTSKMSVYP